MSQRQRTAKSWDLICESEHLSQGTLDPVDASVHPKNAWEYGVHVISQAGDACKEGSWIFYESESTLVALQVR